jgi:hypothetical protein
MAKTEAGPRVHLPEPIAVYLAADAGDGKAYSRCFAENAVVQDEGQTYRGLAAIKQWKAEAKKKYQYTIEPLACALKDGKTVVTSRLTGNFPGSPLELQFVFGLEADRIVSLEIHP